MIRIVDVQENHRIETKIKNKIYYCCNNKMLSDDVLIDECRLQPAQPGAESPVHCRGSCQWLYSIDGCASIYNAFSKQRVVDLVELEAFVA